MKDDIINFSNAYLRNLPEKSYFCIKFQTNRMKKVKITILTTKLNEDMAKDFGICGLKATINYIPVER